MTEGSDQEVPEEPGATRSPGRVVLLVVVVLLCVVAGAAYLVSRGGEEPRPITKPGPQDAPTSAFCDQYAALVNVDDGRSVRAWARGMASVGTPQGLSVEGRAGFELVLAASDQVEDGDSLRDLTATPNDLGPSDQAKVDEFTDYANTTCLDEVERAVNDAAQSDLPS